RRAAGRRRSAGARAGCARGRRRWQQQRQRAARWRPGVTSAFIVAGVCLLVEAFFSGSEMAVVAADRLKLSRLASAGSRGARILTRFLEQPQRLLATTLV